MIVSVVLEDGLSVIETAAVAEALESELDDAVSEVILVGPRPHDETFDRFYDIVKELGGLAYRAGKSFRVTST